ncbi:DMT family transporter [Corynebacterium sputi]|uniref:DMT family transporter n=1 Tax=Corynebacterium sputi TaxID=489915 RepID=UPI00068668BE|nr:DMT family transporter [Corynebacterium sputi]
MSTQLIAVLLGLLSAMAIAWGTVVRHQLGTVVAEGRGTVAGVAAAIRRPKWWAGSALAVSGYGLQLAALGFGSVLLVQPLLVLSLPFSLFLGARLYNQRLPMATVVWSLLLSMSVAVLVVFGNPLPGQDSPPFIVWAPTMFAGVAIFLGLYVSASTWLRNHKAFLLGVATGVVFGYLAMFSKALVDGFMDRGLLSIFVSWELWGLLGLMVLGVTTQQAAFNAGMLDKSLPPMTSAEPVTAFILGYLVLGERFQVEGLLGWIVILAATVLMVAATVRLPVADRPSDRPFERGQHVPPDPIPQDDPTH